MANTIDIESLLNRPEGQTLDFKASGYDLSDNRQKRNFAKDVASLANTPRDSDAYIVLGVKKLNNGTFELQGLDKEIDDADLQSIAASLLDPCPHFVYEPCEYNSVILGLITVSQDQLLPSVPKKTSDTGFAQGKIYFRRGSQNAPASVQEQGQIWDWFRGRDTYPTQENPYVRERSWAEYLAEVEGFDQTARHILVVDQSLGEDAETLSGLGSGPWTFVLVEGNL